jgi:hypothetical protein
MSPKKVVKKSTKSVTTSAKKTKGFTAEEKDAMKERARELKAEARADKDKAEGESDALAKIAALAEPERTMAKRLHALIKASAPSLTSKTWYGMPAYVKDGKIVCFFQSAKKFGTRYATLGFSDEAKLDEGTFWPNAYALTELNAATEAKIAALIKQAVSED